MPSKSTGSATDVNVSVTAEYRVLVDFPEPIAPIYTAISRQTSAQPLSCCIAGSETPARCKKATL